MNNDLISRKWLTDAIRNRRTYLSYEDAKDVIDLINKATSVDIKDEIAGAYNEGFMCGNKEAENARPQGDIHDFIAKADEGTLFQLKKEIENALTKIIERDAYDEARREAMRLDDNEDTLKYRGWA